MGDLNTTPATWAGGENPTATKMNTEIRDAITAMQAAWTAFTPTMTTWTLGNGTLVGKYNRVGKTIDVHMEYTIGSTDTLAAGSPAWSLPFQANWSVTGNPGQSLGRVFLFDTSAAARNYYDAAILTGATTWRPLSTAGAGVSNALPWTWAAGDCIFATLRYESV